MQHTGCGLYPHALPAVAAESLSLSHAVSVVLSRLFEARSAASSYHLPQSMGDLADGFQDSGVER